MNATFRQSQSQSQKQALAPQMRQGLKLLEMDIGELRAELYREMAQNPVVDDIEQTIDGHTTSEIEKYSDLSERRDESEWEDDNYDFMESWASADADAMERRQKFFDSRTRQETLEEHLRNQIGLLDLDERDRALAVILVGSLDANGRFAGSIADLVMASGASEEHIRRLLGEIQKLDPPGCGAVNLRECLLAQIDKLGDSPFRDDVRELVANHLEDIAARDYAKIEAATGMSEERIDDALAALRTLEPNPGRAFASDSQDEQYVKAEVHAVRKGSHWVAEVDERDLPKIRISERYLNLLKNPDTDESTREYIRAKIGAINSIIDAIGHRYDTIRNIAQAIFDAQPGFFVEGLKGLRPLTMVEIAEKVGVHHTTVSRTVNSKYVSTPFGVLELSAFFIAGVATTSGTVVAKNEVTDRLRAIIDGEDKSNPLSDERIAQMLKAEGFAVARRTVAKYRTSLGIPGTTERKAK